MNTKRYLLNISRIAIGLLILLQSNGKALAFKNEIHQDLTIKALPFIRPLIMEDINDEHAWQEGFGSQESDEHFDDCHFSGSAAKINANLQDARIDAAPNAFDSGDLADNVGQLLHTVEDFYSHSNWVDMNHTALLESGLGPWDSLLPYSFHNGAMLVEGDDETPLGPGSSVTLVSQPVGQGVDVFTGSAPLGGVSPSTHIPGIISGTWGPR